MRRSGEDDRGGILCYVQVMAITNQVAGDIESLAEQAGRELLEAVPSLKTARPIERNMAIALALHAEQGGVARLVDVINRDPSFGDLRSGWI